jgi:ribosomal-protein-serine acetyltransferase
MFRYKIDHEVELRLLQEYQADQLFDLIDENRDYLREWLPWVDGNQSADDTKVFIRRSLSRFAKEDGFASGIWYQNRLVGCIDLHEIDWFNHQTSIGYWLSASDQGQGIMTRACRELINYAFHKLDLNRIEICCAPENLKSRAIPEKLGFKQEGTVRQTQRLYNRFVDLVVYGMLASEWQ